VSSGLPVASQRVERAEQAAPRNPCHRSPELATQGSQRRLRELSSVLRARAGGADPERGGGGLGINLPPEKSVLKLKAGDDVS